MLDISTMASGCCLCEWCTYSRRIRDVKMRGEVAEMRQLIEDLSERLWNTAESLSMYEADEECRNYREGR